MLAERVPAAWKPLVHDALAAPSFAALEARLAAEADVLPPMAQVFAALEATPPEAVRVVVLGQDPYPTPGHANGLCFSVSRGVKPPASLRNVFTALEADVGVPRPAHGDLSAWASRGVLLLNAVLTVRAGAANAHRKWGWEAFTTHVLRAVAQQPQRVVFLCLGKQAQEVVRPLAAGQPVLELPHPSPLAGNAFVTAAATVKPFSRINALLVEAGREPIDWRL